MMYPEDMNADDIREFEEEYNAWREEQDALIREEELARAEAEFYNDDDYIRDNDRESNWELA